MYFFILISQRTAPPMASVDDVPALPARVLENRARELATLSPDARAARETLNRYRDNARRRTLLKARGKPVGQKYVEARERKEAAEDAAAAAIENPTARAKEEERLRAQRAHKAKCRLYQAKAREKAKAKKVEE